MKKSTYFYALLFAMLIGGGWTNFAWAIDWTDYAVDKEGLTTGQRYYLYTNNTSGDYTTNHFVMAPASYPTTSAGRSNYVTDDYANATIFTFTQNPNGTYIISYKEGNNTRYFNANWGTYKSAGLPNWNTTSADWTIADVTSGTTTYKNTLKTGSKYIFVQKNATSTFMTTTGTSNKPFWPYMFISEAAYADATASNQYYWTANAVTYTGGSQSSTGGTAKVAKTTYKKPNKTNLVDSDYDTSVSGQKGNDASQPTITVYYKAEAASGYHFVGWFDVESGGSALSTEAEYTYSFTATTAGSGNATTKNIYARFEEDAAAAAVYTGGTGEPTNYATLDAALAAAANGDLVVLLGNIGEAQTISKNITLDFNSYKISGSATNLVTVTGDVTFVDNNSLRTPGGVTTTGATAVLVTGGSLTINDGKYTAATYAVEGTGGSVTIKNGGFESNGTQDINGTITLKGGFFKNKNGLSVQEGYAVVSDIPTGMKYTTTDYRYMVVKKTSENYPVCVVINKDADDKVVSRINFNTLEKAIAYANNNADDYKDGINRTLMLRENYTLPSGNYTIPSNAILTVPYSADQVDAMPILKRNMEASEPSAAYCTLTFANGAHIDVFGAIEVGGLQKTGGEKEVTISRPSGPTYGLMQMNNGSSITLYEDANFYAWGFVQGDGTIDVRRGAKVKEQFQINDWKLLAPTAKMAIGSSVDYELHVLPINQYFIQNVEVKTTYRPGSRLLAQVAATVPQLHNGSTALVSLAFNDVGIIGVKYSAAEKAADPSLEDDVAIFLMDNEDDSEDTWVRKSYDVAHDIQLYEVNNSAYLGSLSMKVTFTSPISVGSMTVSGLNVDSRDFVLPITNNFKIHLLYGNLYVTQDTELLPGSEIEINKKATMTVMDSVWNAKTKQMDGNKPQTLYLYDKDQWGTYVSGIVPNDAAVMGYASRIKYRHNGVPEVRTLTPEGLGDAKLTVHGTVNVRGYLKTTTGDKTCTPTSFKQVTIGKEKCDRVDGKSIVDCSPQTVGGGAITSTINDAGTIVFKRTAPAERVTEVSDFLWQVNAVDKSTSDMVTYFGDHVIPALLTNEDGTFAHTASTDAGTSFCFIDFNGDGKGEWKSLTTVGCFVKDENNVYYAKPQDYVALKYGETSNNNHTYSAVGDRTLILVDDCQWWEVEPVENRPDLFHCTHPLNDMYYYWDGTKWTEKRYTVTWNDWNGDTITTYSLKYGVQPKYLGNIPARDMDAYYTYDFAGWSPEITESTIVTGEITYTAQYTRTDRMYTVTWKDESGNVIETGYFKMGAVPTCESAPDMTNKEWNPAVSAVTGNTTYTLQGKNTNGPFTIKFVNWNGEELQRQTVNKGETPQYTGTTPTKPALSDVRYSFSFTDGWTPEIVPATADAVYTATFTEKPITYTITWKNDDGTTLGTSEVTPNTVPQYNGTPVRSSDGENHFFAGWTPALAAATANVAYTATYTSKNRIVEDETYEVPEGTNVSIVNLIIRNDGIMDIPASSSFNANTLTLESDGAQHSGQIIGANKLYLTGDAIFRLEKSMAAATWYAVAVPWTVNINKGIYAGGKRLSVGEFFVIEFDANAYASADRETGTYWNFLDETGKDMKPGKLYMIWLKSAQSAIEFHKTSGNLLTTSTTLSPAAGSIPGQSHWNAIANPALFHANLATGAAGEDVLKYNGDDAYIVGSTTNMIVGEPMFVQTATSASVTAKRYTGAGMPAYHRAPQTNADNRFVLELTKENQLADRLIVQTAEEKANEYVIGKDLSKMGVSSKVAQMWIERYDAQLCKNTIELLGEQAEYPLSLFAPAAGEYVLSASQERGESVLYLTRNGQPVWNLSYGEYVLNLEKGTTTEYGLRLIAKAPQITTGIGNVQGEDAQCTKVLRDGVIYILRGEKVYTIDGQLVK